jgi:1-aminocyclopropane-1-carboxylate deaminase
MLTASELLTRFTVMPGYDQSGCDQSGGPCSPLQRLSDPFGEPLPIQLYLKRDDLLHPTVSGNKWRKLKYNLVRFRSENDWPILTFGGAYSNHLRATAAAGYLFGFQTIGIVRGDELRHRPLNPTLSFCQKNGMTLDFWNRSDYRQKDDPAIASKLLERYGLVNILPEGGTDAGGLAAQGVAEVMPEIRQQLGHTPDWVCCAVGTGGTLAGLMQGADPATNLLGINVVTNRIDPQSQPNQLGDYTVGGYGKTTPALLDFIQTFQTRTGIRLDPIYTGKLLFALRDLARQGYFPPNATVVAVHTGGVEWLND